MLSAIEDGKIKNVNFESIANNNILEEEELIERYLELVVRDTSYELPQSLYNLISKLEKIKENTSTIYMGFNMGAEN